MPKLKKTLPKNLDQLLDAAAKSGDESPVREALSKCDPNAYVRGYTKSTLLENGRCSFELARWAVERGTDINAVNTWGRTALHESAASRFHHALTPEQLIELGADIHQTSSCGLTPLHSAADGKNVEAVRQLLAHGADIEARNNDGKTPMEYALSRMQNIDFIEISKVCQALLEAGARCSEDAQRSVLKAAKTFEFYRDSFNKDLVEECSDAVGQLCELFAVTRPTLRKMHDGVSPIVATADTPQKRHAELWELLVPGSGPCETLQGEVVRIAGRIHDEWSRNGGTNWDRDYSLMAKAFLSHIGSGIALEDSDIKECQALVKMRSFEETERLLDWAQQWVGRNPEPLPLSAPEYQR